MWIDGWVDRWVGGWRSGYLNDEQESESEMSRGGVGVGYHCRWSFQAELMLY